MDLKPLTKKRNRSVLRLLKLIFPAMGIGLLYKIYHKERQQKLELIDGLKNGELFWQSFFNNFQPKNKKTKFLEITYGKKFCGLIAYSELKILKFKILFLKFFALKKSYQGQGLGSKILQRLEKIAKRKNCEYIWLLASPFKKTKYFYFKKGFKRYFWGLFVKKV